MITLKQFKDIFPRCPEPEEWFGALQEILPEYDITNNNRIAGFLSQCGHESAGWRLFEENLNYSEKALNRVFSKYFKRSGRNAKDYARNPRKIANIVYANRIGNGDTASGDGWKFRGRGPIQLTGKANYANFSKFIKDSSILDNPDQIFQNKKIGILSAIWFWDRNNLNQIADLGNVKILTKKINGGYNGLKHREELFEKCLESLNENIISPTMILKIGSRGTLVQKIQKSLGIKADGIFGKGTKAVVKAWQRSNNLVPDGIVGPKTYAKLMK